MSYFLFFNGMVIFRLVLRRMAGLRTKAYPALLLLLFLYSAFRLEVGCDWSGYFYQYMLQKYSDLQSALAGREPLWFAMIEMQLRLGLPYPFLNVLSSAIFFVGVHVLGRRQPDPLAFLILLFPVLIINMPMSGIRQGAAIGLLCLAFAAFLDKRLLLFVGWTLLASLIHSSAIVMILLAPLVNGVYSRKRVILAIILAIPGALVLLSGEAAEMATSRYISTDIDAAGAAFRLLSIALSGLFFLAFLRKSWAVLYPGDYKLASVMAWGMIGVGALLPVSSVIGDRLGYYFVPVQAMIFARVPFLNLKHDKQLLTALPYLGLLALFLVWTQKSHIFNICYQPYQTWLLGLPKDVFYLD